MPKGQRKSNTEPTELTATNLMKLLKKEEKISNKISKLNKQLADIKVDRARFADWLREQK
jgi:hypothetical protein